jgi:hypothetical protein
MISLIFRVSFFSKRQLGSGGVIECLKRLTFDQIPDESGAGIWWNMVTQKWLTANGIKVRWREDSKYSKSDVKIFFWMYNCQFTLFIIL